jgi:hypothetical protein
VVVDLSKVAAAAAEDLRQLSSANWPVVVAVTVVVADHGDNDDEDDEDEGVAVSVKHESELNAFGGKSHANVEHNQAISISRQIKGR